MQKKTLAGYVVIFAIGAVLATIVYFKGEKDYNTALENYKIISHNEAENAAKKVQDSLNQIYQNIRTISFLPSVKIIDRHGTNLDSNAHQSIQQIYNNIASNVAVSEVYVVPVDLNPEEIDPVTNQPQAPILMFDELIVNPSAEKEKSGDAKEATSDSNEPEEVEIYEYRLLKEQMSWLKDHYPDQKGFESLNLPVISGREVITCDNTDYIKTKDDKDRSGIILSVPFYGDDSKLKGTISAIIRSNAIKDLLPKQNFALTNSGYNYIAMSNEAGQERKSSDRIAQNKADPSLLYSEILPISLNDPQSKWALWVGYPDEEFLKSAEANAVKTFRYSGYGFAVLLTILCLAAWTIMQRSFNLVKSNNAELERKVSERAAEIERLANEQKFAEQKVIEQRKRDNEALIQKFNATAAKVLTNVTSSATQMHATAQKMTQNADLVHQRANGAAEESNNTSSTVQTVAAAAEELTASISEIASQAKNASKVTKEAVGKAVNADATISTLTAATNEIGEIINVISDIAEQINLLALNATIESARAGEAGKGFAVVASEVKNLAGQTTKATEEITIKIENVQSVSKEVAGALMDMKGSIEKMNEISNTITAAVEEQGAATQEIAKSVQLSSSSIHELSGDISEIKQASISADNSAKEVLNTAKSLSTDATTLDKEMKMFIEGLKVA